MLDFNLAGLRLSKYLHFPRSSRFRDVSIKAFPEGHGNANLPRLKNCHYAVRNEVHFL